MVLILTKRDRWQWAAVLIAACILTYANGLGGGFTYDDKAIVRDNPRIRSPGKISQIFATSYFGGPRGAGTVYRPVLLLSYAVQWWIHGRQAVAFHAVNVLLHAGATLLLAALLLRIAIPPAAAFAGALLFAVAPIHVEAVTSLVGRGEVLAAVFTLLYLHLALRHFRLSSFALRASEDSPPPNPPGGAPLLRARGAHQGERIVGTGAGPPPFRSRRRGGMAGTPGTGLRPRASGPRRLGGGSRRRLSPPVVGPRRIHQIARDGDLRGGERPVSNRPAPPGRQRLRDPLPVSRQDGFSAASLGGRIGLVDRGRFGQSPAGDRLRAAPGGDHRRGASAPLLPLASGSGIPLLLLGVPAGVQPSFPDRNDLRRAARVSAERGPMSSGRGAHCGECGEPKCQRGALRSPEPPGCAHAAAFAAPGGGCPSSGRANNRA